jgi:hypothetical protein
MKKSKVVIEKPWQDSKQNLKDLEKLVRKRRKNIKKAIDKLDTLTKK